MMKVAICGMADDDREIPHDFEVWIIAQYIGHFTRYDRAFECHIYGEDPSSTWRAFVDDPWCEFYVPEHLAGLYPKAELIPIGYMGLKFFKSFGSTISYMLAQAIHENADEIALYGVGMCQEYEGQRPSAFYWLGVANGLGIKTSGLLTEEMYGVEREKR